MKFAVVMKRPDYINCDEELEIYFSTKHAAHNFIEHWLMAANIFKNFETSCSFEERRNYRFNPGIWAKKFGLANDLVCKLITCFSQEFIFDGWAKRSVLLMPAFNLVEREDSFDDWTLRYSKEVFNSVEHIVDNLVPVGPA